MLSRLLRLLAAGHGVDARRLAHDLGVSQDLVVVMLEDLARRGLLHAECPAPCEGCPGRPKAITDRTSALWALTLEGERLAGARFEARRASRP